MNHTPHLLCNKPTQTEERAILEFPDKGSRETAPASHTELLLQKITPRRQLTKQSILGGTNNQKEPPKMGRQRKSPQSYGKEERPVKELNEFEGSNLSDAEFKKMVKRMLKELSDNYKELSRNCNNMKKEIENVNKNQGEMKNTISEIQNILEGIKNRLDEAED